MTMLMQWLHFGAGLLVLAEALNKLERTCPLERGLSNHARLLQALKAMAWFLLALGAGGAVAAPLLLAMGAAPDNHASVLMRLERPTLAETAVLLGFAVLIVRTRVKEG